MADVDTLVTTQDERTMGTLAHVLPRRGLVDCAADHFSAEARFKVRTVSRAAGTFIANHLFSFRCDIHGGMVLDYLPQHPEPACRPRESPR